MVPRPITPTVALNAGALLDEGLLEVLLAVLRVAMLVSGL
jgi:hypothetical protein